MLILKKVEDIQGFIFRKKQEGHLVGFVPTMGALHQGHLQLIEAGHQETSFVVCSIFVNPTQFNNSNDFAKYPITLENDILALEKAGCHLLFLPDANEIYPNGTMGLENYDLGSLETLWEGAYRPGHFQGVCQVVNRLLQAVNPDFLFLGQKDLQQCKVIQKLLIVTNRILELIIVPTVREPSGLAMSSRNLRLSADGLLQAAKLYSTLQYIQSNIREGDNHLLLETATRMLIEGGFESVDYLSIVHKQSMVECSNWNGTDPFSIIAAAYIETVRLIDNIP